MELLRWASAAALLALATVPQGAAAQPGASPPSSPDDDVDLAALGLEVDTFDDKLNIFGFVDVSWSDMIGGQDTEWAGIMPYTSSFAVGSLNVYLTRNLSRAWRTLVELRYTYAPGGAVAPDGTYTRTTSADPANLGRPVTWGGMVLERAYLEYDVAPWLTVRAGTFLTPYGIWNVDHGSPAIIPTMRPYIIGEQLFPERQTGVHAYGKHPVGDYTVGYHLTLSNGRGALDGFQDLDANKAIGGRLELEAGWLGGTRIGVSGYRGRFTDRPANTLVPDAMGNLTPVVPSGTSYDEYALGADLQVDRGALHVQAEVIMNHRRYRGAAPLVFGMPEPGGDYLGSYVLAGYRLERWWQVMPFAVVEANRPRPGAYAPDSAIVYFGGLNFRPVPSVVLKAAVAYVDLDGPFLDEPVVFTDLQAAWVF